MQGRRGAGRPTREEAATIETQVLDAARKTFCDDGFAEVSMDRIAQCIGASKLTIYRRYPSKEALLVAMVDRDIAWMRGLMQEEGASDLAPIDNLYNASRRLFEFITTPDNLAFSLFLKGESARRASVRERFGIWTAAIREPLAVLIGQAQIDRQIRMDMEPATLADALLDLIDGIAERLRHKQVVQDDASMERDFAVRWDMFRTYSAWNHETH